MECQEVQRVEEYMALSLCLASHVIPTATAATATTTAAVVAVVGATAGTAGTKTTGSVLAVLVALVVLVVLVVPCSGHDEAAERLLPSAKSHKATNEYDYVPHKRLATFNVGKVLSTLIGCVENRF